MFLKAEYNGHQVNVVRGMRLPTSGHCFRLENAVGLPVGAGYISAWELRYESRNSADEIFRRMFCLPAEDAQEMDETDGVKAELLLITPFVPVETTA